MKVNLDAYLFVIIETINDFFKNSTDGEEVHAIAEAIKKNTNTASMDPLFLSGVILGGVSTQSNTMITKKTATELSFEKYQDILKEFETTGTMTSSSPSSSTVYTRITPSVAVETISPTRIEGSQPSWSNKVENLSHYIRILQHNLPRQWVVRYSERERREYYIDTDTNIPQWDRPPGYPITFIPYKK